MGLETAVQRGRYADKQSGRRRRHRLNGYAAVTVVPSDNGKNGHDIGDHNHKGMKTDGRRRVEEVLAMPHLRAYRPMRLNGEKTILEDATKGAILVHSKTGIPRWYVRHAKWRGVQGAETLAENEVKPVYPDDRNRARKKRKRTDRKQLIEEVRRQIGLDKNRRVFAARPPIHSANEFAQGSELELYIIEASKKRHGEETNPRAGEMKSAMNPGDAIREDIGKFNREVAQKHRNRGYKKRTPYDDLYRELTPAEREIGASIEMLSGMVELNFAPSENHKKRNAHLLHTMKMLRKIIRNNGALISPVSTFPLRDVERSDVNKDGYIQRIVFEGLGWDTARYFKIMCLQTHTETIDMQSMLQTYNTLQLVKDIPYAITLSGPFMLGRVDQSSEGLQDYFKDVPQINTDPLRMATYNRISSMKDGAWHSLRYPGRFFGSDGGGVPRKPLQEVPMDFWEETNELVREGIQPSPARTGGAHADRARVDLPPHRTIEDCTPDTAAARMQRVVAYNTLMFGLTAQIQGLHRSGNFDRVAAHYPALFGQTPSDASFNRSHFNLVSVAKDGNQASVVGMDGQSYTMAERWGQLKRFLQEPVVLQPGQGVFFKGLPDGIVNELDKAFTQVDFGDPLMAKRFAKYRDGDGIISMDAYYDLGYGNASDYMIQRAHELMDVKGLSEEEAIRDTIINLGEAFDRHVARTDLSKLEGLFNTDKVKQKKRVARNLTRQQVVYAAAA